MMDQISKADLNDVKELDILINSAYRGDTAKLGWTNESELIQGQRINEIELRRLLSDNSSTILKYISKEKILGCVLLQQTAQAIYLGMLTVSPTHQSTGIGKNILSATEQFAKEKNYDTIKMTVISVRHELIEFYKRNGYFDTGLREPFPQDEKFGVPNFPLEFIVMSKQIK
jgi:ribosomal protein S18 acetylase RimI-like enzyme